MTLSQDLMKLKLERVGTDPEDLEAELYDVVTDDDINAIMMMFVNRLLAIAGTHRDLAASTPHTAARAVEECLAAAFEEAARDIKNERVTALSSAKNVELHTIEEDVR